MPHLRPRVLWIYARTDLFGEAFNSVLDLLRYRDREAFDVRAVVPGPGACQRQMEDLGVPVHHRDMPEAGKNLRFLRAIWSFRQLLQREAVDLVYFPDYFTWRPAALVAAHWLGVPAVAHLRTPSPGLAADPSLRAVAAVIGNSAATLESLRGSFPAAALHVVYNCVDFAAFGPGADHRGAFFPAGTPLVGFVGTFRPEKGVDIFLDMARHLRAARPDVRFLAVGGDSLAAPPGELERMQRYAAALGVTEVVRFLGLRTDIAEIMRTLDVLVVPSRVEGFGRVIVEANAVGTPVVATRVGGIPEILDEGETGWLVPPESPIALADAVARVLSDAAWRARVAAIAPARVRARFAPAQQVRAIEAIWRGALAGR